MLESELSSVAYSGNASGAAAYEIPFPFLDPGHVAVIVTDGEGIATSLTPGTDFTVAGTRSSEAHLYTGGSLTTAIAYASTSTVTIRRVTPVQQPAEFVEAGPFPAETLEISLDRLAMIAQEIRRDASPADSNIAVSGAGLLARTTAGTFAVRTISPATGSGLVITDGDGVSGNPTIDTDFSALPEVTALADTDLVPARVGEAESAISVANLRAALAGGSYGTFSVSASAIVPDRNDGCAVTAQDYTRASEIVATFVSSSLSIGYFRVVLPGDYSGGDLKLRLFQGDGGPAGVSGNVVWQIRSAISNGSGNGLDISGNYVVLTEGFSGTENACIPSGAITIGSGFSPGDTLLVEIMRDPEHENDDMVNDAFIAHLQFQYPRQAMTSAWS